MQQIDRIGVVPISGTEGGRAPFISPDGEWIGFFSGSQMKKVAASGGTPIVICDVGISRGAAWGESGLIVVSTDLQAGLSIVSEDGGKPEPLTTLDESQSERSHRWPSFLPGGDAVLFQAQRTGRNYEDSTIKVVSVGSREMKVVHSGGSYARYAASGQVLFAREGSLFAIPFDLTKLESTGTAKPVLQELLSRTGNEATDDGTAHYDVSSNGTLVYRRGVHGSNLSRLTVTDQKHKRIATSRANNFLSPALSPDKKRVAVQVAGDSNSDIWIWDIERNTLSRLTFEEADDGWPVWSPDGKRIVFTSPRATEDGAVKVGLFVKSADGSGSEVLLDKTGTEFAGPTSWSDDGRTIIYIRGANDGGVVDIAAITIEGDEVVDSRGVLTSPAVELFGDLSPNGKWLAYQSNESGEDQIYARRYPGPGGKWQISVDGGAEPEWIRGGRGIVWRNRDQGLLTATVSETGESLVVGQPEPLGLQGRFIAIPPYRMWDVSDDGDTFVFLEAEENSEVDTKSVILITNWFQELTRLAPVK